MIKPMKFRKLPVEIQAMRWQGTAGSATFIMDWINSQGGSVLYWCASDEDCKADNHYLKIETLEGPIYADKGDYIVQGVKGEFYPCKPDIFTSTYESVSYYG